MNIEKSQICCSHILNENKNVLIVGNIENKFQFLCGCIVSDDNICIINYEKLIEHDDSLIPLLELKKNHFVERKDIDSMWSYYYDNISNELTNDKYLDIKNVNDIKINHLGFDDFLFLPSLSFELSIKPLESIKKRAFALSIIVQLANNIVTSKEVFDYVLKYNLTDIFTQKELSFIKKNTLDDKINETWKVECLYIFLFYLNLQEELSIHDLFDLNDCKEYPLFETILSTPNFIENKTISTQKSINEMLLEYDFYSRLDYICDFYNLNNFQLDNLNSAQVFERRYALEWLLTIKEWDEIECNSIY